MTFVDLSGLKGTYEGDASYYDLPGNKTANGEFFDGSILAGAMQADKVPILPTEVTVKCGCGTIKVRINDRGPWATGPDGKALRPLRPHPTRIIDLTPAAFKECAETRTGVIKVTVEVP